MVTELAEAPKVVGVKQVKRALSAGTARRVFLAEDADPRVIASVVGLCGQTGVETESVPSMQELGTVCGLSVGAAAAALLLP